MAGLGRLTRASLLQSLSSAYAALSAGDPGDSFATFVEPTIGSNGYARQLITWAAVPVPASGADAVLANSNTITFTSTGSWNASTALSHIAVMIASSSVLESNYVGSCVLVSARLVDRAGIVITLPPGAVTLTIGLED